jgi:hypothetical protein
MDALRAIQRQWQAYVEAHCDYIAFGVDPEDFSEASCLVDAYDRRLSDLLPMLCGIGETTCAATEEFERRHQRR